MSDSFYVGQIVLFPYNFVPRNFLACQGQVIPIKDNEVLFSLIGTTFGGNGEEVFRIPDLTNQAPKGMQYCIAVYGEYPPRS